MTVKPLVHPTVSTLILEAKRKVADYQERSKPEYYTGEIQEQETRIRDIQRLWDTHAENTLVLSMVGVVDKVVNHYHADFFFHDLMQIDMYKGRFAWYVGEYGTHFIWLDNEDEEQDRRSKHWLNAVNTSSYGRRYTLYEGNTLDNTLKRKNFSDLVFKITNF